jgi:hypothetical protein
MEEYVDLSILSPWISASDRGKNYCGDIVLFISISTAYVTKFSNYLFSKCFSFF